MKSSKMLFRSLMIAGMAAAMVGMTSCDSKKHKNIDDDDDEPRREQKSDDLEFESFSYHVIMEGNDSIEGYKGSQYQDCRGEGVLPKSLGNDNVRQLRDSLMAIIDVRSVGDGEVEPIATAEFRPTDLSPADTEACNTSYGSISASLVNPRLVVFNCYGSVYYCGAAHGSYGESVVNYDIENGKILSLYDVVKPAMKAKLRALINESVKRNDMQSYVNPDIDIAATFRITNDGLEFIYQPYEVAPYAVGMVKVLVYEYELAEAGMLTQRGEYIFNGEAGQRAN